MPKWVCAHTYEFLIRTMINILKYKNLKYTWMSYLDFYKANIKKSNEKRKLLFELGKK